MGAFGPAAAAPAEYAPASHAPLEGRVTGVIVFPADVLAHSGTKYPVQREVRFVPAPMVAAPAWGAPDEFNPRFEW